MWKSSPTCLDQFIQSIVTTSIFTWNILEDFPFMHQGALPSTNHCHNSNCQTLAHATNGHHCRNSNRQTPTYDTLFEILVVARCTTSSRWASNKGLHILTSLLSRDTMTYNLFDDQRSHTYSLPCAQPFANSNIVVAFFVVNMLSITIALDTYSWAHVSCGCTQRYICLTGAL